MMESEVHAAPDLSYKVVAVLNEKLEAGVALNAAAHLAMGLTAKASQERPELFEKLAFLNYTDADGGAHDYISALSLVVLRGRPGQLRQLRSALRANGILTVDFTDQMTGETYAEQLVRSRGTREAELVYYGVAALARRDELDPLTKKFSLWR